MTEKGTESHHYRIEVEGALDPSWSHWFGGLEIGSFSDERGRLVTRLQGPVADRAALYGILDRLRDLNLALLLVQREIEPFEGGNHV